MLKHRKINPTLTKTKVGTISSRKVLIKKSKDGHPQHLFSMNYKFGKLFWLTKGKPAFFKIILVQVLHNDEERGKSVYVG